MTLRTEHQTRTLDELVSLYKQHALNLEPAFQRQSVWTVRDRRELILSVLNGIPLPSIYLYKQVGRGGKPSYDVIDGKQRIESMLLYMGKGPLAATEEPFSVRTSFDDDNPLDNWWWTELTNDQKHRILTARVPTIEVEGELSDVIELFVRINSTGKKLTAQERRHARFHKSPTLRAAQRLADSFEETFKRHGVMSAAQMQRMKHVELFTELILSAASGSQPLDKKAKIDALIGGAGPEKELPAAERAVRKATSGVLTMLPDIKSTRFRRSTDFYSLTLLLLRFGSEGVLFSHHDSPRQKLAGQLLTDFGLRVDEVQELLQRGKPIAEEQHIARDYIATVREGSDSARQRRAREKILREVLDGVFEEADPARKFSTIQRRILWNASAKKRCSICKEPIVRWEDLSIDHVHPYVRGGRTSLANAAIAHRSCNSAKGTKRAKRSTRPT